MRRRRLGKTTSFSRWISTSSSFFSGTTEVGPTPPRSVLDRLADYRSYFAVYLHVALLFTTKIFDLYRLNWWPKRIGGRISYFFFWAVALSVGWLVHDLDLIGAGGRREDGDRGTDWERKSESQYLCVFGLPVSDPDILSLTATQRFGSRSRSRRWLALPLCASRSSNETRSVQSEILTYKEI